MITIFHASNFRSGRRLPSVAAGLLFLALGTFLPLRGDPTPSLDQLYVVDQGAQLRLIWHFYPKLLPSHLVLPGPTGKTIDLSQASILNQNLHDLVLESFTVQLNGQVVAPTKLDELTVAPDGGCFTTLLYPGRRGGRVALQDNLLPFYPAGYVMNYELYNPRHRANGVSGYFSGGARSPLVHYTQQSAATEASSFAWLDSLPVLLFKTELRTPWININWLLLSLAFLLTRPVRRAAYLVFGLLAAWLGVIGLWAVTNIQLPWGMPAWVAGLITAVVCLLCERRKDLPSWLWAGALLAGLINACLDVQQIPFERPVPSPADLAGLGLGFTVSLAVIFGVGSGLISECRRYPEFQSRWAPKICWILAVAAIAFLL